MASLCEEYAKAIMGCLVYDGTDSVFEEFIYWTRASEKESPFERYVPQEEDRRQNYLLRCALSAMDFSEEDEITRIDMVSRTSCTI
eukprot:SAG11_NODE_1040_length_6065_cov_2.701307_5_plen_86_part_00